MFGYEIATERQTRKPLAVILRHRFVESF
jgi:hypothetical protein